MEHTRSHTLDPQALDCFIAYLQVRRSFIPNYRQWRIEQRYIGSGHVEKANDLIDTKR